MTDKRRLLMITGPNMGEVDKARQAALIVILAHMGCFVPAREAEIDLWTNITRIGAPDDIASGRSNFMVR